MSYSASVRFILTDPNSICQYGTEWNYTRRNEVGIKRIYRVFLPEDVVRESGKAIFLKQTFYNE